MKVNEKISCVKNNIVRAKKHIKPQPQQHSNRATEGREGREGLEGLFHLVFEHPVIPFVVSLRRYAGDSSPLAQVHLNILLLVGVLGAPATLGLTEPRVPKVHSQHKN